MSERLRLLLTSDAVGGVWTYSLQLAKALAAAEDVATILSVLGPSPSVEQLEEATAIPGLQLVDTGLPLDWTATDEQSVLDTAEAIAKLAGAADVDLVQLHTPALACAKFSVPVVSVVHSCMASWWAAVRTEPLPEDFGWRARLTGKGLRQSSLAVAPTRAFARAVQQAYKLKHPIEAVHNGRSPLAAQSEDLADHAFVSGRLWDEGKNIAVLDRAAALATTSFLAAGPLRGPNGASLELQHIESLGVLTTEDLAHELSKRPIFVSAALYEPFGLSVLEAAQAGCALVLSDIPTFRELWDGAALFIEPGSEDAIAATVDLLASQPDERERLGTAALERSGWFTPELMAQAMLTHYRHVLPLQRRAAA
jgi:glycosyltransferase involved in cell wall biosynthesis